MAEIRLSVAGKFSQNVDLEDGETVADLMERKRLVYPKGYKVSINGVTAAVDEELEDGDILTIHESPSGA